MSQSEDLLAVVLMNVLRKKMKKNKLNIFFVYNSVYKGKFSTKKNYVLISKLKYKTSLKVLNIENHEYHTYGYLAMSDDDGNLINLSSFYINLFYNVQPKKIETKILMRVKYG